MTDTFAYQTNINGFMKFTNDVEITPKLRSLMWNSIISFKPDDDHYPVKIVFIGPKNDQVEPILQQIEKDYPEIISSDKN